MEELYRVVLSNGSRIYVVGQYDFDLPWITVRTAYMLYQGKWLIDEHSKRLNTSHVVYVQHQGGIVS